MLRILGRSFTTRSWRGGASSDAGRSWRGGNSDVSRSWKSREGGGGASADNGRSWKSNNADSSRSWKGREGGGSKRSFDFKRKSEPSEAAPVVPGEPLHGIHGVRQALRCNMRTFHQLMLRDTNGQSAAAAKKASAEDDKHLKEIKALALEYGIPVTYESKWTLNHVTEDKPHQGVVLFADPVALPLFDAQEPPVMAEGSRPPVILALDEIHDAQNFGAVLRSAYFLGAHAVLTSTRNNAPLSAAVLRASVGASEVLAHECRLFETPNMHQALATSQQLGWTVVGACSGAKAISSAAYDLSKPTILVVGNEHRGLKPVIRRCCDDILTIPGGAQDDTSAVDSLNVSVATGILLYQLLH
ncbi:Aste57867_18698 [Aphanomyces stellatus]|uniref:rRNA methyltransferase 1, mitochondrial n=1 Tax=Aphanomyces stellatus TaxID=120398 RepID=A0A485LB56_9STRA|nr:hypothetical protein As57867_018635 [Aphanomyces stellatus]VFT95433.1 Aste57867_18698 [Aphanomyces stellatus]